MVNPVGPGPEAESVTILNASSEPVDLSGWRLADRMKRSCPLPDVDLAQGGDARRPLGTRGPAGQQGRRQHLARPAGLKVDGVAYAEGDLPDEGWTIVF